MYAFLLGLLLAAPVHLEGEVPDDGQDYLLVDFEVPAGTVELEIAHSDGSTANILDWGVFSPDGFRGYGGGLEDAATIGELASSRGYLTGPMTPGTWRVLIGKAQIDDAPARYVIDVTFRDVATLAPQPRSDTPPPVLATGAAWYAGDLHVHSEESGDAAATFAQIHELARARGLDFVVLSDHNTVSQHVLVPAFQATVSDLLFVRGAEITTYGGHGGGVGIDAFVDFRVGLDGRTIGDVIAAANAAGGFFVINHPLLDLGDACIGCAWSYEDTPWEAVGGIEIQTGSYEATGTLFTPRVIALWEERVAAGHHLVAVGGSDDHRAGRDTGAAPSVIGSPTTLVYADALSEPALLAGLRAGRVVVKLRGPDDPFVELFVTGADGIEQPLGATVAGHRVTLRAHVLGGEGHDVAIYRNGELAEQRPVVGADFVTSFEYDVGAGGDRFRATIFDGGADVVLTNHVFATFLAAPAEPGGCGCVVARRAGGGGGAGAGLGGLGGLALLAGLAARRVVRRDSNQPFSARMPASG